MNEIHFLNRRSKLLDIMEEGVAIITSAPTQTRSNDTEYSYRQNSDFYYLSGFNEDNSVLVLIKTPTSSKTILFVEAHNAEHALWNGARLGIDGARERFSVDEVHDVTQYFGMIKEILREHINLYIDLYNDSARVIEAKAAAQSLHSTRGVKRHIRSIRDVTYLIHSLRLIKSPEEIETIKKAIAITAEGHHQAMEKCRAGMIEYQLQAIMNYVFLNNGAMSEAYGAIVAGGNNANTLHYVDNRDELRDGDLVLIDAACEWELYASDITRTFPINGKFSDPQREVYNAVLDVQLRVIEAIRVGVKRDWFQTYSEELLCGALIKLGVLNGELCALIEAKEHKKYAPHGIGHWMGLDVHDPCPYVDELGESLAFMAGMVMTIEPGLYFRADDESVPERYRGIGIRIEDNILVTKEGYENLSSIIAKSVEEIELMCNQL
ncbi:MAG: aminopeptidase P N-terminal domain-containing protein [Sulfuricurvum sp.]|uniref:aminopeptidase P N-terminal domain-containing protein n=1 Tax=Sulfuricurvum sp. TaxID=2025608 RepID=UPI0025E4E517|nr:aminopeptidase P N-terminal domain-containing protein [Sulfuricurvum sp.]MBV5320726.1 aminopeptidase P N-terminal domain-containing protein [Sulfuricurvum sp.]